jgi:glycosyltransferase involved in cell wall biosynthesis
VRHPRSPRAVAEALGSLLADSDRRASLGRAARARAEAELDYDRLAEKLAASLEHFGALATIL